MYKNKKTHTNKTQKNTMPSLGNVYGFTGNKHTGKRTLCRYRATIHGAVHIRFGQNIEAVTKVVYDFLTDEHFTDARLHLPVSDRQPDTPYELFRRTERAIVKANNNNTSFFLEQTLGQIEKFVKAGCNVWISNVCSNVEATALKNRFNASIIKLTRKTSKLPMDTKQEVSEDLVDDTLANDGSIEELYRLSDAVISWKKSSVFIQTLRLKTQVLNNTMERMECIGKELLEAKLIDGDSKVSRPCYRYTIKDGKTVVNEITERKIVENAAFDEICKDYIRRLSELIFTSRGVE